MWLFQTKEKIKDPYENYPIFCEYDGKTLLNGKQIQKTYFDTKTGKKKRDVMYTRYCPNWQTNTSEHTHYPRYTYEAVTEDDE